MYKKKYVTKYERKLHRENAEHLQELLESNGSEVDVKAVKNDSGSGRYRYRVTFPMMTETAILNMANDARDRWEREEQLNKEQPGQERDIVADMCASVIRCVRVG